MAGRPLGMRSLVRAIAQLSPTKLKSLLASAPRLAKIDRLEQRRDKHLRIAKELSFQIEKITSGNGVATRRKRARRGVSQETRRKMAEAAKRRWAKKDATGSKASTPAPMAARKRHFSPEARAKMAEAAKRRWARVKGQETANATK